MSLFDSVKEAISQKDAKIKGPILYKADCDSKNQLEKLKELSKTAPKNIKSQIDLDISLLSYGITGEENVVFELCNSYLPIIILHDLHIEYDGLTTQIDFLVITKKINLIIECKNLFGNIEVNSNGDFIRSTEYKKKEGIYSPVTQNIKHLEMIKKIKLDKAKNIVVKTSLLTYFNDFYKSVVVLANPKTVIDLKCAKKEIKDQIIRCDQLIDYIKQMLKNTKELESSEKEMYAMADFFLGLHSSNTTDYTKKYHIEESKTIESNNSETIKNQMVAKEAEPAQVNENLEDTLLYKELKQYRLETSKAEGNKAYFVFSNTQLEAIIASMPKTLEDIRKISGFGEDKCKRYGNAILEIVKKYS